MKSKTIVVDIIGCLFILLFIYAASSKLMNYQKFTVQLAKSPLLSVFSHWFAWLVPVIEIAIGSLLLFKKNQLLALYLSFSLMVMFSTYIIAILNFSEYVPCSCGGILENMNWNQHLWFNIAFVMIGALAVLLYPGKQQDIIGRLLPI